MVSIKVRGRLVFLLLPEFQFLANVSVERSDESAADGRLLWVIVRSFADQVVGRPGKSRVQAPRRQSAIALEFLHKLKQAHAQVGFLEIVFTQPGEARHFLRDLRFFRFAQLVSLHQRVGIFATGEFPCLIEKSVEVLRAVLQCFVEPCGGCITGEIQDVREILTRIKRNRA